MRKLLTVKNVRQIFDHINDYVKTSPDPDDVKIKTILKKLYNLYHHLAYGKGATEKEIEKALEGNG